MWCLNQHDKFKHYGLFFHVGLDPYPGIIHWCKVWWTVRNPKLIASFYINSAWAIGGAWPWLDYLFSVGLNLPSSHRAIQEFLRESFCCFADWELFRGVTEGSWAGWGWSTTGGCFWFCRPSWMFLILRRKYQWWMFQIPTRRGTELASNFSYINY